MFTAVVVTGAISICLTFLVRWLCIHKKWVTTAVGDRLQHAPTPRLGGVAIVGAFVSVSAVSGVWRNPRCVSILIPSLAIFALGLADDLWQISPRLKFFVQLGLSLLPVFFGVLIPFSDLTWLNAIITVLWFVGLTNAFNLLDNMNGLCGGIAVVVSAFRALIALLQHDHIGFFLCVTLCAAILGFLIFNFPKGLIFMGDCGALFLGFTLAGVAFTGTHAYVKSYLNLLVLPVALMLVPICDTTFVTFVRILCGRPISQGGRDHLSHSLVATGLSQTQAVIALWLLCASCGTVSLVGTVYGSEWAVTLFLVLLAAIILTTSYLARYQIGIGRGRTRGGGIILSVLSDLLLTTGCYYGASIAFAGGVQSGIIFFLRTVTAVVGAKLAWMGLLGCYPILRALRPNSIFRLLAANAFGSLIALIALMSLHPPVRILAPVLDFLVSSFLLLTFRSYARVLDRVCSSRIADFERDVPLRCEWDRGEKVESPESDYSRAAAEVEG